MTDEKKLIDRALAGDRTAFARLVEAHLTVTYRMAFALTANREDAEDLTQETFLQAYRSLERFRQQARFSTWLTSILRNVAADRRRRDSRWQRSLVEPRDPKIETGHRDERLDEMERAEAERRIAEAIETLPEHLRLPMVLHYCDGETSASIGERLGLTAATVRKRLELARKKLRGDLEADLGRAMPALAPAPALLAGILEKVEVIAIPSSPGASPGEPVGASLKPILVSKGALIMSITLVTLLTTVGIWTFNTADPLEENAEQPIAETVSSSASEVAGPTLLPSRGSTPSRKAEAGTGSSESALSGIAESGSASKPSAPSTQSAATVSLTMIDEVTREPVAGAEVELLKELDESHVESVASGTTDAGGRLKWTNIEPGTYFAQHGPIEDGDTLTEGRVNMVVEDDDVEAVLERELSFYVSGIVREIGTGDPVEGVDVEILYEDPDLRSRRLGVTDSDGRFRSRHRVVSGDAEFVSTREYRLIHRDPIPLTLESETLDPSNASSIELTFPWSGRLTGRVVDRAGMPVPECRVFAWPSDAPRNPETDAEDGVSATTDSDGAFILGRLPTETPFVVSATADGYAFGYSQVALASSPGQSGSGLLVTLDRPGRILVTTRSSNNEDSEVLGRVSASREDRSPYWNETLEISRLGEHELTRLAPGLHRVFVDVEGFLRSSEVVDVSNGITTRLEVRLERDPKYGSQSIRGTVRLQDGSAPAKPVHISCDSTNEVSRVQRSLWTEWEPAGEFTVANLPEGRYVLKADYAGFGESSEVIEVNAGDQDVRLVLPPARLVSVEVRDAENDEPLRGVELVIRRLDKNYTWTPQRTDADGRSELLLPDGQFELTASAQGLAAETVSFDFSGQQQRTIQFRMQPGRRISGRVVDEYGEPLRCEVVLALEESEHGYPTFPSTRVATGADGTFTFNSAPLVGGLLGVLRMSRRDEVIDEAVVEAVDGVTIVVPRH